MMNKQRFYLRQYDWVVTVYYSVTPDVVHLVMRNLIALGCSGEDLFTSWRNISSGRPDTGLTFSNYEYRSSLLVVGHASSFGELMNSVSHEIHHLSVHIAEAYGLDLKGEEICYIDGKATQMIFETPKIYIR